MVTIGLIGLSIMGAHMARNLFKGDRTLIVNGKHSVPEDPRSQVTVAANSAAVARAADIIIAMVPDTPEVAEVLFEEDGVAQGLAAGKPFIDMSSISPIETQDFAKRVEALGADYLDAPVSGGEVGACGVTLTTIVGGKEAALEHAKPLFTLIGRNITHVGESGVGQTYKVANQIIAALTIEAVGEALLFASKAGADPACVRQVLIGGFASSRILEVHGERMIKWTFDPGFRIELHQRDLNLTLEGAHKLGIALSNTATAQQLFNVCAANGGEAWDYSTMVRVLELMADHAIA